MRAFVIILLILLNNFIRAQNDFDTNEFLKTSFEDIQVRNYDKIIESVKAIKFNQPWLKSVNARVGITGAALGDTIYGYLRNEDNYALFIEPNSIVETRWQKRVKSSKIQLYQAEQSQLLENAIHKRYDALLDYYWTSIWQDFISQRDSLNNLKISWIQQGIALSQNLDIDDVLRADREKSELELKKEKLRSQELENKLEIQNLSTLGNIIKPTIADFIDLKIIENNITKEKFSANQILSIDQKLSESKINYLTSKANYINSQNRKIFNDLRLSYDDPLYLTRPKQFNTFNNFSLRVGLNLPIPANNRFRKAETQLDIIEERLDLEKQKTDKEIIIATLSKELNSYIGEYKNFVIVLDNGMVNKLINNPQTKTLVSPVEWIDLKLRSNEYEEKKLKLEEQIYRKYFELLKVQGRLSLSPYKNYLLKSQSFWAQ